MADIPNVELSSICKFIDYRGKTPEKTLDGIPLITAKIVKGGRIEPYNEYIAEADYESWMRRGIPLEGDVIITTEAPLGEVAEVPKGKVAFAQRIIVLSPDRTLATPRYLKYALQSPSIQNELTSRSSGSVVTGIRSAELQKVLIPLPKMDVQNKVSEVLGSLDDKIELNRKINETLESMAKAIFKEWFIDFGPVKTKADSKKPFGIDAKTAALFPDCFEESPIGLIPSGWNAASVTDLFEINPKYSLKKGEIYPYTEMKDLPTNSASISNFVEREFASGSKFSNGDTLIARITPCLENGKTALVDYLPPNVVAWGSTEFIVVRSKPGIPLVASYLLARLDDFRNHLILNMSGTSGRQRVPESCLEKFKIANPPLPVWDSFNRIVSPMFDQIRSNTLENNNLTLIRDMLLPKLISGEIALHDV